MDNIKFAGALLVGYLLGRTKKGMLALTIAGGIAAKQLGGGNLDLNKMLDASPQLKQLSEQLTGQLADAAKNAAVAAASEGLGSATSNLGARTEQMRSQARDAAEAGNERATDAAESAKGAASSAKGAAKAAAGSGSSKSKSAEEEPAEESEKE